MLNAWINGQLSLVHEEQSRGHLLGAHQLESMSLPLIRTFYGMEA